MKRYAVIAGEKIIGVFYIKKCAEIYAAGLKDAVIQTIII
jgi:hypothetical protein